MCNIDRARARGGGRVRKPKLSMVDGGVEERPHFIPLDPRTKPCNEFRVLPCVFCSALILGYSELIWCFICYPKQFLEGSITINILSASPDSHGFMISSIEGDLLDTMVVSHLIIIRKVKTEQPYQKYNVVTSRS